jgi:hypothetical protein
MRTRRTAKRKKAISRMPDNVISTRSREMLKHSAANLKKGLASAPIALPMKRSDMEIAWKVQ